MKLTKAIVTATAAFLCCLGAFALDLPVKKINGKAYYYYVAQKNEFIYELSVKMGLPRKDILKYNPNAADGLQAGTVLTVPVSYDAKIKNGYYVISHKAGSHETVYGIAQKYGISVDRLIDFNPTASDGINKGETLVIPVQKAEGVTEQIVATEKKNIDIPEKEVVTVAPVPAVPVREEVKEDVKEIEEVSKDTLETIPVNVSDGTIKYIMKDGETIESIAQEYDLNEIDILKANPQLSFSEFVPGALITIPVSQSLIDAEKRISERAVPVAVEDVAQLKDDTTIALMLPFSLEDKSANKHSQLYTEFYRGFLIGVEKQSHSGSRIKIEAYDSAVSNDSVKTYISENQDIIITSDNIPQMKYIISQASEIAPDAKILNLFAVKDSSNVSNVSVIQANIPRKQMYDKAIQMFMKKYEGYVPVFIARIDGNADKSDFVSGLKERLSDAGVSYHEIAFRSFLGKDNLDDFNTTDSAYVFIPVSGLRTEFAKFAPALKTLRSTAVNPENVTVFGYPEWVTFRSDYLEQLHGLNASIYSRFYISSDDERVRQFRDEYKQWYGSNMLETVPVQSIVGYDAATFLIKYLRGEVEEDGFEGIQTGFNIVSPEGMEGYINSHLYLINFRPDGTETKVIIK